LTRDMDGKCNYAGGSFLVPALMVLLALFAGFSAGGVGGYAAGILSNIGRSIPSHEERETVPRTTEERPAQESEIYKKIIEESKEREASLVKRMEKERVDAFAGAAVLLASSSGDERFSSAALSAMENKEKFIVFLSEAAKLFDSGSTFPESVAAALSIAAGEAGESAAEKNTATETGGKEKEKPEKIQKP